MQWSQSFIVKANASGMNRITIARAPSYTKRFLNPERLAASGRNILARVGVLIQPDNSIFARP